MYMGTWLAGEIYVLGWGIPEYPAYLLLYIMNSFFYTVWYCEYFKITVAVEEENEMDGSDLLGNQFDKLGTLQKHLIRHRELFLSRQVETYKIDMVRSVWTARGRQSSLSVHNSNLYSMSIEQYQGLKTHLPILYKHMYMTV